MNIKFLAISILSASLSVSAFSDSLANTEVSAEDQAKVLRMVGEDSNKLLKSGASYALKTLNEKDKLPPFALILKNDGTIGKLQPLAPFIIKAPTVQKINYLRGQIKNFAEKGEIKAGALFSRGFGRSQDKETEVIGLIVEAEHRNGPSTVQFVPVEGAKGQMVAKDSTAKPKPRLFFNKKISSDATYKQIKQAVSQAEK